MLRFSVSAKGYNDDILEENEEILLHESELHSMQEQNLGPKPSNTFTNSKPWKLFIRNQVQIDQKESISRVEFICKAVLAPLVSCSVPTVLSSAKKLIISEFSRDADILQLSSGKLDQPIPSQYLSLRLTAFSPDDEKRLLGFKTYLNQRNKAAVVRLQSTEILYLLPPEDSSKEFILCILQNSLNKFRIDELQKNISNQEVILSESLLTKLAEYSERSSENLHCPRIAELAEPTINWSPTVLFDQPLCERKNLEDEKDSVVATRESKNLDTPGCKRDLTEMRDLKCDKEANSEQLKDLIFPTEKRLKLQDKLNHINDNN